MSTAGLLAMGVLVTLIVGSGLALLVYGAILDGREEADQRRARSADLATNVGSAARPAVGVAGAPAERG
jgi:hypothetical protein